MHMILSEPKHVGEQLGPLNFVVDTILTSTEFNMIALPFCKACIVPGPSSCFESVQSLLKFSTNTKFERKSFSAADLSKVVLPLAWTHSKAV